VIIHEVVEVLLFLLMFNLFCDQYLALLQGSKLEDHCNDEQRKERLHWTLIFSQLIAQWAQWLGRLCCLYVSLGRLIDHIFHMLSFVKYT
jgi:hypothetical protein